MTRTEFARLLQRKGLTTACIDTLLAKWDAGTNRKGMIRAVEAVPDAADPDDDPDADELMEWNGYAR